MPNGMYGGGRGRKTKVGRKLLLFSSYSMGCIHPKVFIICNIFIYKAIYIIMKESEGLIFNDSSSNYIDTITIKKQIK